MRDLYYVTDFGKIHVIKAEDIIKETNKTVVVAFKTTNGVDCATIKLKYHVYETLKEAKEWALARINDKLDIYQYEIFKLKERAKQTRTMKSGDDTEKLHFGNYYFHKHLN